MKIMTDIITYSSGIGFHFKFNKEKFYIGANNVPTEHNCGNIYIQIENAYKVKLYPDEVVLENIFEGLDGVIKGRRNET